MHLIIQIPCYNEAATLPEVIADLPQALPGISRLEALIIDDGSGDDTVAVAHRLGIDQVVRHSYNRGLAAAFQTGLETCLKLGADIIVNTDGDHQYPGAEIARLVEPILAGQADIVIGDRQTHAVAHFSPLKRFLQQWGSWVVRLASGAPVPDATSGFRAYSREAALRMVILTRYTYTLETIIQAGKKGLRVVSVPIQVNAPRRESRLIKSNWAYVKHSAATIVRLYTLYEPLKTFTYLSLPFLLVGLALLARFFYFYITGATGVARYIQSIAVGGTSLTIGFLLIILGVIGDLIATNRLLIEETLYRTKRQELAAPPKIEQATEPVKEKSPW